MINSGADSWVSCPGKTVSRMLWSRGMNLDDFRANIGWTETQCDMLFKGTLHIGEEAAADLARTVGPSKSFWIQRETGYRKEQSTDSNWLQQLPVRELVSLGWIADKSSDDHRQAVLDFFGVSSPTEWSNYWPPVVLSTNFKHTVAYESEIASVASWLRRGELLADQTSCQEWSDQLACESISTIRGLTRIKDTTLMISKLASICASFGVAVIVEKPPQGCRATGATRWLSPSRALLLLSGRYLTDDHFWFAFFHELGHLILHRNQKTQIEMTGSFSKLEDEANKFAQDAIIPPERWAELSSLPHDLRSIVRFATSIGVSRSLVVGQLQHIGRIHHSEFNWMKRKFKPPYHSLE
jgi:HTH-type transcriptional regulator/antitoxin HigA